MPITLQHFGSILDEFARAFGMGGNALVLLTRIGFPLQRRPAPTADGATGFWLEIANMLDAGIIQVDEPFRRLLEEALTIFPGNNPIRGVLDEHPPEPERAPVTPPAGGGLGAAVVFRGSNDVVVLNALAQDVARRRNPPMTIELLFTCASGLYFHLSGADLTQANEFGQAVAAEMQQRQMTVSFNASAPVPRDYLISRLCVEGPDQTRFEITDIPSSTTFKDVARGTMGEYDPAVWGKDGQGKPRPAVVDHVRPDGTPARQNPEDTLNDAGVQEDDTLTVHPESRAGSIHAADRDDALVRVRIQVSDYAVSHPGFEVLWDDPIFPTEYEFHFQAPSWAPPTEPQLQPLPIDQHKVYLSLPAEFPRVAPQAYWLTPIFHPNIDQSSGKVCLGALEDRYRPGMDFGELCQMLVDMAHFRNYLVTEFYNREAREWAVSEEGMAMIESRGGRSVFRDFVDSFAEPRPLQIKRVD